MSKSVGDQFVNSCQKAARQAVNHNQKVQVEFKMWPTDEKSSEPKVVSFCFPPPPPPATTTTTEQENERLRAQVQALTSNQTDLQKSVELLEQQLNFLKLEMTK